MAKGDQHNKITIGFVIQIYEEQEKGKLICIDQEFIAGDEVDYEDTQYGESITVDTSKEQYQPCDMVQPGIDYWYVQIWGCIEPTVFGPFETEAEREKVLSEHRVIDGEEKHTYHCFDLPKGVKIEF